MSDSAALDLALRYFRAWSHGRLEEAAGCLADDLVVEVPINDYPSRASFVRAVGMTVGSCSGITPLSQLGGDGEAVLVYDMSMPFGVMRVAEHFSVTGGRIARIRQIHDTHAFRQAMDATAS